MPIMDDIAWNAVEKSDVAKKTTNPIRNVVDRLKIPPNPEKTVISLGLGDPTAFGNLQVPVQAVKAVQKTLLSHQSNGYPPAVGYEKTRAAIARRYTRPEAPLEANDVVVTSGCSGALEMVFSALAHSGQTILLPQPGFSLYKTLCDNKGIKVKYYRLIPERNWEVDLEHVEGLLDDSVKGWLINNPSNPCGSVYSRQHLIKCKELAAKHRLMIVADEIYEDMVFSPNEFHPMAILEPHIPLLTCGGLAKRFLVPGWRVGWILIHDQIRALNQIRGALVDLAGIILGANSIMQAAIPDIFDHVPESFHLEVNQYVGRNADIVYECLAGTPGLSLLRPQGALYMMVGWQVDRFGFDDDIQICERLISEESVLCLPGTIFGMKNYIRIVYCAPPEMIEEATGRIKAFCARHYR
jgi:tyrosine aminotransferase